MKETRGQFEMEKLGKSNYNWFKKMLLFCTIAVVFTVFLITKLHETRQLTESNFAESEYFDRTNATEESIDDAPLVKRTKTMHSPSFKSAYKEVATTFLEEQLITVKNSEGTMMQHNSNENEFALIPDSKAIMTIENANSFKNTKNVEPVAITFFQSSQEQNLLFRGRGFTIAITKDLMTIQLSCQLWDKEECDENLNPLPFEYTEVCNTEGRKHKYDMDWDVDAGDQVNIKRAEDYSLQFCVTKTKGNEQPYIGKLVLNAGKADVRIDPRDVVVIESNVAISITVEKNKN